MFDFIYPKPQAGLALIELLLSLAILAILTNLATPTFSALVRHQTQKAATAAVRLAIKSAQLNAIESGITTSICSSQRNSIQCSATTSAWQQDLLIFTNHNRDQQFDPLQQQETLISRVALPDLKQDSIHINRQGLLSFNPNGSSSTPASLWYCSDETSHNERYTLSMTGRLKLQDTGLPCP